MNRRARRARIAHARSIGQAIGGDGWQWTQRADPADPGWVLIEMRIPNGGMPEARYAGREAADRLLRFCRGFLGGHDDAASEPHTEGDN